MTIISTKPGNNFADSHCVIGGRYKIGARGAIPGVVRDGRSMILTVRVRAHATRRRLTTPKLPTGVAWS